MTGTERGWRPRRQHRRHVYYKVQIFSTSSLTWTDEKSAFDEISSARDHISKILGGKKTRIMVVDDKRRYPLEE
jgi:hypothetical protein